MKGSYTKMNKVWLFGETSEFSQSILTQLKKKSNDIQTFGRRNISYDDPIIEQINLSNLPDKIIINVNLDWELIGTRYSDRWVKPLTIINSININVLADMQMAKRSLFACFEARILVMATVRTGVRY